MFKPIRNFIIIFFIIIGLSVSGTLLTLNYISQKLGKSSDYLAKTIWSIRDQNPYLSKDKINFLILGLDERDDALEKTETTDTIIFASLNLKNFKVTTISLPRDLWSYPLEEKINEIYPLSLEQNDKFKFIKENFKSIINQDIDHVLVINTNALIDFVNLIGGVDVTLEQGFTDNEYPNPDYINNPVPKIPKYTTVQFEAGQVHLDESNVTQFVRSRHAGDLAQGGTDLARIQRQQLLLEAIMDKIKSGNFIKSPSQIFDFYKFWDQKIVKDISDLDLFYLSSVLGENISQITLNKVDIQVGQTAKDGLIYHPTYFSSPQWVFIPSDKEYKQLQDFISQSTN